MRKIVLVRDVYDTTMSIRRMIFKGAERFLRNIGNRFWAEYYWCTVHENLLALDILDSAHTTWVRYEDMVGTPKETTQRLFDFVGSCQKTGVNAYNPPEDREWKWGEDDGGRKIRSLKVHSPPPSAFNNTYLLRVIHNSERILSLRKRLGYNELPEVDKS